DAGAQGVSRDHQDGSCPGDIPSRLPEHADVVLAHSLIVGCPGRWDGTRSWRRRRGRLGDRQDLGRHHGTFTKEGNALDDVGQFSHVAWPVIRAETRGPLIRQVLWGAALMSA